MNLPTPELEAERLKREESESAKVEAIRTAVKAGYARKPDNVDHPGHYGGDTTYEAIKVIEAWALDFCLGNAVKYICRAGRKDGALEIEDLQKARWYLDRRIAELEKRTPLAPSKESTHGR